MGPEQRPEQHAHSPPQPHEVWHLEEGELKANEVRNLGHLLYAGMFTGTFREVVSALRQQYEQAQLHEREGEHSQQPFQPFDVVLVSGMGYVGKFAEVYGLNSIVLTRWAHTASIELAQAVVPVLVEERKVLAEQEWWGQSQVEEYTYEMIEPILDIAQHGIGSLVENHRHLVGEAYYMDRNLGPSVPLNSSLVRSLLDSRT